MVLSQKYRYTDTADSVMNRSLFAILSLTYLELPRVNITTCQALLWRSNGGEECIVP